MQWKTFLKAHAGAICAVDCFSVEVLTFTGALRHRPRIAPGADLRNRAAALRRVDEAGRAQPHRWRLVQKLHPRRTPRGLNTLPRSTTAQLAVGLVDHCRGRGLVGAITSVTSMAWSPRRSGSPTPPWRATTRASVASANALTATATPTTSCWCSIMRPGTSQTSRHPNARRAEQVGGGGSGKCG